MANQLEKLRARILVKAYPQPSEKFQETVCVAAISEDGSRMLRLYPVRFRHLGNGQRFTRFDLVEATGWQDTRDGRPESYRIDEDSITRVVDCPKLDPRACVRLWRPFVWDSLAALKDARKDRSISLGIIRPDPGSVQFSYKPIEEAPTDERLRTESVSQQMALFERQLKPLPSPRYVFRYAFMSGGIRSNMAIHDWEIQTTYHKYVERYGADALRHMSHMYGEKFPQQNLHLIMGTMKAHPHQFIIIGVLRTNLDLDRATAQQDLFAPD